MLWGYKLFFEEKKRNSSVLGGNFGPTPYSLEFLIYFQGFFSLKMLLVLGDEAVGSQEQW